ncbi:DNA gyrase inhibitor YacG [Candidatus Sulfopaludibacter sp. SbA3]|nr:DNA gyrase inhibitor YacG [Candidatus Sulfopaludibacter sp. SbA3]
MTFSCPICKKPVKLGDPDFPFCSERCRILDLGAWSAEKYRISSSVVPPQEDEEPPDEG